MIEVGLDDEYLRHVLDTHADDIKQHQPTFAGRALPGQEAFVIAKGDETVGVVVVERDGDIARMQARLRHARGTATSPPASSSGAAATCSGAAATRAW